MKHQIRIFFFMGVCFVSGIAYALLPSGAHCTGDEECESNYCRLAFCDGRMYCAQDATTCVDNISAVVYQFGTTAISPCCGSEGYDTTPGILKKCDNGHWNNSVSCGYSSWNACYNCGAKARDVYYCEDGSPGPTGATCYDGGNDDAISVTPGKYCVSGIEYDPDATNYCSREINCVTSSCSATIYYLGCAGAENNNTPQSCTATNKQGTGAWNADSGKTTSETNYKNGTTCTTSTANYCSSNMTCSSACARTNTSYYCNGAGVCSTYATESSTYVAAGKACLGGSEVNPSSSAYCDISIDCTISACSASRWYRGCSGTSSSCVETNKQASTAWYPGAGTTISETTYKSAASCAAANTLCDSDWEICSAYGDNGYNADGNFMGQGSCDGSGTCDYAVNNYDKPRIAALTLNPSTVYANSVTNGSATALGNSAVYVEYLWYAGESLISSGNETASNNTAKALTGISSLSSGQVVNLTVRAWDANYAGSYNSTVKTVQNSIPTLTALTPTPKKVRPNTAVNYLATSSDVDNDVLRYFCSNTSAPDENHSLCSEGNSTFSVGQVNCTFTSEAADGNYTIYCRTYDNISYSPTLNDTYTVTNNTPIVQLTSPASGSSQTSTAVTFHYSVNASETLESCELWDDSTGPFSAAGALYNDTTVTSGADQAFAAKTYSVGTWTWNVYCCDTITCDFAAYNSTFTISTAAPPESGGPGGPGQTPPESKIIIYGNNLTATPHQIYEFIVTPIHSGWTYPVMISREVSSCKISAPFNCTVSGSTVYVAFAGNITGEFAAVYKAELEAVDQGKNIARIPIQLQIINLGTYYAIQPYLQIKKTQITDALFALDEKQVIGVRLWWITLIAVLGIIRIERR
jgi:hypothetical protein